MSRPKGRAEMQRMRMGRRIIMNRNTVLIVDDEKEIADLAGIYLTNEGYRVLKAYDATDALRLLEENPDVKLMVLDIMMPGMDGLTLCRKVRETSNIPILILSAKSQDLDKVLGLATGADDYLAKPFNPLELTARVKSLLRRFLYLNPMTPTGLGQARGPAEADEEKVFVRGLVVDRRRHTVAVYGREVSLTPTEFDILFLLAKNKGLVLSAEEIFERVWKERYFESNNTVMVHIRKIREKLEDDPSQPEFIRTVWGVGYKIEA
jgi:two-component system response regulator VanR